MGFRRGYSTTDNIFMLMDLGQYIKVKKRGGGVNFIVYLLTSSKHK